MAWMLQSVPRQTPRAGAGTRLSQVLFPRCSLLPAAALGHLPCLRGPAVTLLWLLLACCGTPLPRGQFSGATAAQLEAAQSLGRLPQLRTLTGADGRYDSSSSDTTRSSRSNGGGDGRSMADISGGSVRRLAAGTVLGSSSSSGGGGGESDASSSRGDGYSALCVVGRNENRYVREWVEYHKCLGFSRVYLYDHNSSVPLSAELPDHIASGLVHYVNFSAAHRKFASGYTSDLDRFMATVQGQAYRDCVQRFGGRHTFLGFIDLDEFLVLYDSSVRHVDELLRQYESYPGLSVYWVLLGSSGHVTRPDGPVVESYTRCTPRNHKFNTQFKTFANTRFKPTMYSPHRAVFAAPPDPATGLEPYMVDEAFRRIPRGRNKNSTHARAAIFHYVTKSAADFNEKMARGGGAGVTRPKYYFSLMDRYSKETCLEAIETRRRFCGVGGAGGGSGGSGSGSTSAAGSAVAGTATGAMAAAGGGAGAGAAGPWLGSGGGGGVGVGSGRAGGLVRRRRRRRPEAGAQAGGGRS